MFLQIINMLFQGFAVTLSLFAITIVFAVPLGLPIALGSRSRFRAVRYVVRAFVWVIRSTPLMLQVLAVSFIPSVVFHIMNKDVAAAFGVSVSQLNFIFVAAAFIINYACYFSEIYRAGIAAVSKGQYEAGKVLGLTKAQTFRKVVLLQVIKHIVPPMGNEIITLVKDTSLARILGVIDLLSAAQKAVNGLVVLSPLIYVAVFYLIFNGLLTLLLSYTEKKLGYFRV